MVVYLILSAIGAGLLILVALLSEQGDVSFQDRLIVGAAFITSALFGISLAIRPGWTRASSKPRGHLTGGSEQESRKFVGHHPDCETYRTHVMRFGERSVCAGCFGLALGSIVGIVLMIMYVFFPGRNDTGFLFMFLAGGLVLVAFGFSDIAFNIGISQSHAWFNTFMVLGFFAVVVSVHQVSGSVALGLVAILISFLWLDTRIQLSRWRHVETCKKCSESCKAY